MEAVYLEREVPDETQEFLFGKSFSKSVKEAQGGNWSQYFGDSIAESVW